MNLYIEISTKNLIDEIIFSNPQLQTKDKNLQKISRFLKSNPDTAQILFSYLDKLKSESEKSINNRDNVIRIWGRELGKLNFKYQKDLHFFEFVQGIRDKSFSFDIRMISGEVIKAGTPLKVKDAIKQFYYSYKDSEYIKGIIELIKNKQNKDFDNIDISEEDILKKLEAKFYDKQQPKKRKKL